MLRIFLAFIILNPLMFSTNINLDSFKKPNKILIKTKNSRINKLQSIVKELEV
jgi:hypothetical protein